VKKGIKEEKNEADVPEATNKKGGKCKKSQKNKRAKKRT